MSIQVRFCLRFPSDKPKPDINAALRQVLDELLPNDTAIWRDWKSDVLERIVNTSKPPQHAPVPDDESGLRKNLLQDANSALELYDNRGRL